ncbi:MAG: hypothetical protein WD737_12500 [Gemmatimonadota bacterium]
MRLALGSEALPESDLEDLLDASRRRGFAGVELVAGGAHGIGPTEPLVFGALRARHEEIVAYRAADAEAATSAAGARLAGRLGAPVVSPAWRSKPGRLAKAADHYAAAEGELLLSVPPRIAEVEAVRAEIEALDTGSIGIALDVQPMRDDLSAIQTVLAAAGPRLRIVRLHGGGPEGAAQTGRGIGHLMAALALNRYAEVVVLTPTGKATLRMWAAWLGRAGGWGCGSKAPLTVLTPPGQAYS